MSKRYVWLGLAVAAIVGIIVAATLWASKTKPSTEMPMSNTNTVVISGYTFEPKTITVAEGTTVKWTNQDSVKHNVVADKPSAEAPNGPLIGKGETYSFTFTKAGSYDYHCMPHPTMHGTVVVTAK